MDKAIFTFDNEKYTSSVCTIPRELCERLSFLDEEYVCKYDIQSDEDIEMLLEDEQLDTNSYFVRVFICE